MGRFYMVVGEWNHLRTLLRFFIFVFALTSGSERVFGDHRQSLQSALDQQDVWLSTSPDGDGWNNFLQTSALREELSKSPSQVDRRKVAKVLGRYKSKTPGLEHPTFATTRQALSHWANDRRVALAVRWAEQVREQALNTPEIDDLHVQAARREMEEAAGALNTMLNTADSATLNGWKDFLKWDSLSESYSMGTPNWDSLSAVGGQFFNGHPGLEFPEFVRVRNSLRKYLYLGKQGSKAGIQAQMGELARLLDVYNKEPSTKHAGDVAAMVDWLDKLGRVPALAPQIRAAHSLPNMKLRVSENLLTRRFSQSVNESLPVNENILGTQVNGTAVTSGQITTDIVANPNVAQIDIVFRGNARTRSVGRQKPVTIQSTSVTGLEARKPLYIFPNRVSSRRAVASGRTNTTIHSITPDRKLGRRLIEKIAWKRAGKQKAQAEAIASQRTSRRLEEQIDKQSTELLTRAQVALREQLNGPINRRGLIPENIRTMSFDQCAVVYATQASPAQFAARTYPPNFCPQDDVVAQVHESAFNNTAEKAIAGLTLTDKRVAELTKEVTGEIPEELKIDEDSTPWSISFAWNQPVTVEFDDEMLKIAIRARRLTEGDSILEFGRRGMAKHLEISACYRMQVTPSGVNLIRKGDVEVVFAGKEKIGLKETLFKTLMEKKFQQVFKEEIQGEGFSLPGQFADLGAIRVNDLSAEDGWLSVGWK